MLNSVQHNVPAWTMFAMFFILYPLAGNFIKEREEGSMLRLRLISGSQWPVISGKFGFYFLICLVQFLLMIAVGIYIMPLLGLTKLVLGSNPLGILITACSVAMAATGYGVLIAVYFRTAQQALIIWICFSGYPFRDWWCLGTDICDARNFTDRQPIFSHELGVGIF